MAHNKKDMADIQPDKRKRSEQSSLSELDSSVNEASSSKLKEKESKQKKKKTKTADEEKRVNDEERNENERKLTKDLSSIMKQMNQINAKLEKVDGSMKTMNSRLDNVMMKDDGSLRETIKDLLVKMKDDLLQSVIRNIEVIEGKLFDKEKECDELKQNMSKLQIEIESQKDQCKVLQRELSKSENLRKKSANDIEQYSRRNNLKISGLDDPNPAESAVETRTKVIQFMREKKLCNLTTADIDIAHRLPNHAGRARDIIVKFVSRYTRDEILRNRKLLKGSRIFINEDLTRLNSSVFMCVKKKMPDEVSQVWTRNGTILYRNHTNNIHSVKFEEFDQWLDLPWPGTPARI